MPSPKVARRRKHLGMIITTVIIAMIAFGQLTLWAEGKEGLPVCSVEDASNCYWDADLHGNGQGRSFEIRDGVVYYEDGGSRTLNEGNE